MQRDPTPLPFLGTCDVCGKVLRNYRALSQHLRFKNDDAHRELKNRWHAWRSGYRATLRCRKCGGLFEITDKSLKDSKRCPRCEVLWLSMSKRQYEKLRFDRQPDPRRMDGARGSKASWPVWYIPEVEWEVGDPLYKEVERALEEGWGVVRMRDELGITFHVVKAIVETVLGVEGCAQWILDRQVETVHRNRESARLHSKLEQTFVDQLQGIHVRPCARNAWMTIQVGDRQVHREVDIKVPMGDGRKILILCDGIVFHGPGCLYADPEEKAADDRATALAFYGMGYTVLRYSGDEIRNGSALDHFQETQEALTRHHRIYRNWHPLEELYGGNG